ncbi:MAG: ThiF family adenylyltransferase, partial [bacterium]
MKSICQSSVVVVGLGGVGSHAANMLARAGVGYLRLIDFDQVTLSSLNRHACAT